MAERTKAEKENLCKRCGLCCREKLKIGKQVYIFLGSLCPYLYYSGEIAVCKVYEERCELVECLNIEQAIERQVLPASCGYKEMFPKDYIPAKVVKGLRDITR
jgi:uncharacterized cysteine cluster protein YcgN (CxxCxxCC family)